MAHDLAPYFVSWYISIQIIIYRMRNWWNKKETIRPKYYWIFHLQTVAKIHRVASNSNRFALLNQIIKITMHTIHIEFSSEIWCSPCTNDISLNGVKWSFRQRRTIHKIFATFGEKLLPSFSGIERIQFIWKRLAFKSQSI